MIFSDWTCPVHDCKCPKYEYDDDDDDDADDELNGIALLQSGLSNFVLCSLPDPRGSGLQEAFKFPFGLVVSYWPIYLRPPIFLQIPDPL